MPSWLNRKTLAWALIDWGNSAFALVVMTALFPVAFKKIYASGLPATESTLYLGLANTAASLGIALAAPILGALADQGGRKKAFLLGFTLLGCAATAGLCWAEQGHWGLAAGLYALAAFGFAGNNTFYDSFLPDVAEAGDLDAVSALGYSLGYLGSAGLFVFDLLLLADPARFGLADKAQATQLAFGLTAAWWLLFTVPALLTLKEQASPGPSWRAGLAQLRETLRQIRGQRRLWLYLAAYLLYIDGVNTVIKMSVDYGLAIGLDDAGMLKALLLTQLVGVPAALLFGLAARRTGVKAGIGAGLAVYMLACVWGWRMDSMREFYILALAIGLVQGGVQSLSRSAYARLIPPGRSAEYFGFYNVLGKFAAVMGPTLMGITASLSGDSRASILSLLLLFGGGWYLLMKVPLEEGRD